MLKKLSKSQLFSLLYVAIPPEKITSIPTFFIVKES